MRISIWLIAFLLGATSTYAQFICYDIPMPQTSDLTDACPGNAGLIAYSYTNYSSATTKVIHRWRDFYGNILQDVATSEAEAGVFRSIFKAPAEGVYFVSTYVVGVCESDRVKATVTYSQDAQVVPPVNLGVLLGPDRTRFTSLNVCDGEMINVIAHATGTSVNYEWYGPDGSKFATGSELSRVFSSGTYTVRAKSISKCGTSSAWTSTSFQISAKTVTPPALQGPAKVFKGDPQGVFTVIAPGATSGVYQWMLDGNLAGTSSSFVVPLNTLTGNYTVSCIFSADYPDLCATRKTYSIAGVQFYFAANVADQDANLIEENTVMREGVLTPGQVDNLSIGDRMQSTRYFDGLGRPVQRVMTKESPGGLDVVQPMAYDPLGRENRKYLPVATGVDGWYKPNLIDANGDLTGEALNFYSNPGYAITGDARPYSETVFENSPLNRPLITYGPGQSWYQKSKAVGFRYLSNIHGTVLGAEKVIAWKINVSGNLVRESSVEGLIESGGYYSSHQLVVNASIDESGNAVREYKDKTGQLILKKVQVLEGATDLNNRDHWALTYYIYDDFGDLRLILQPELSKLVHQDDVYVPAVTDLNNFAFQYTYDGRRRMVMKKVPGSDWVYMVYDERDRLVLSQDGNQRAAATKYWTFTKYDALNRIILTGIKDTTVLLSQHDMQDIVDRFYDTKAWASIFEEYKGASGVIHGYTNRAYPVVTTAAVLDINRYLTIQYYDTYDFLSLWALGGDAYKYHNDELSAIGNGIAYNQSIVEYTWITGQKTGAKTKVLDGGVSGGYTWLKSVSYYDNDYRPIHSVTDNYKGGVDRISNLYDFAGKTLMSRSTHQTSDVGQWKDLVGVSIVGNKITRTVSGSSWGTSGLASVESMPANTDGWVEFTASEENTLRMLGLSAANTDANYPSIGYAFYLRNDKTLWVYEGSSKGQIAGGYKTGDVLRIQRIGTRIKYFRNGIDVSPIDATQISSATPLYVDIALGTSLATIINVKSSFSGRSHTLTKRFTYDHVGRPLSEYHTLDGQDEVVLAKNEYNELGQLIDKKLHSIAGAPFKQSVDYRYTIRGWLTNINNSQLDDGENDYFGMNLAYNEEQGTGNGTFVITPQGQVGSYTLNGNATDASAQHLDGVVHGAVAAQDQQGNAGQAYAFGSEDYIEIPDSKAKHSFIQNTGKFTIAAFVKIDDLSARSVILSSTATSANKGFLFMYETYGGTFGDHQLRFTITNGQPGVSSITLGAKNTINDTNWHHVAVVGDGTHIRFYVDGAQDGPPTPITLFSTGDASYATLIGKSRATNGALFLGMTGSMDEVNIFERALSQREIQALSQRATAGSTVSGGEYNGNISGIKWSVNQGIGDIKEMAYNFDYDPMNRLTSATSLQSGGSQVWQAGKYDEGGLLYDLNGNIKNLVRYGNTSGIMDNLTYNYGTGTTLGNQLFKVTDAGDKFTGFAEGVNTTNDYTYDANGNMLTDQNKGMSTAITYNYLNLPELVVRSTGSVRYIYDAAGRKLAQVATYGSLPKQTDYVGEFQYENDDLQFINHEEGRIVVSKTELVYSFDGSTTDQATAVNATLTNLTANGDQTYLMARATSATARSGMFPVGGTFPVQPGERYRIRARGYRDKGSVTTASAAYILAQANGVDLAWPGAALQSTNTTEAWVEQIVTIPAGATELQAGIVWGTVLEGNTIYLNDFEITRLSDTEPEYQYFLKDHLGNIRLTFTTKKEIKTSLATLEDENEAHEKGEFIYYDEAIKLYSDLFDHTNNDPSQSSGSVGNPDSPDNSPAGYAVLLRGGANERYGLAKSLSVMPGDTIKMEVYAKYIDSNTESWSAQLTDLMASIATGGNAPVGTLIDGGAAGSIGGATFPFAGLLIHPQNETSGPKAYLNWIVFDRDYQYKDGGYIGLSEAAAESGQNVAHERLAKDFLIKEPGYVYIYLSNENDISMDVLFDDFKVEQVKSSVMQMDDYYPFGLSFNSYQREELVSQGLRYNGKECQDELGLNWLDYGARMYMPELGRWGTVDPLADQYYPASPYVYALNNPENIVDPDGRSGEPIIDNKNKTIEVNIAIVFYGTGATADNVAAALATINNMWNANASEDGWSDAGDGWRMKVNAYGAIVSEDDAYEMAKEYEGNSLLNFVRVEDSNERNYIVDEKTGEEFHNISYMNYMSNSGFWISSDMKTTTPAHEIGHGLGLANMRHSDAEGIMVPATENRKVTAGNVAHLKDNILSGATDKSGLLDKYLFNVNRMSYGTENRAEIYQKSGAVR